MSAYSRHPITWINRPSAPVMLAQEFEIPTTEVKILWIWKLSPKYDLLICEYVLSGGYLLTVHLFSSHIISFIDEIAGTVKADFGGRRECWSYFDILGRGLSFGKNFKMLELEKSIKMSKCNDFNFFFQLLQYLFLSNEVRIGAQLIYLFVDVLESPLGLLLVLLRVSARSNCETRNSARLPHFLEHQIKAMFVFARQWPC